VRDDVSRYSYQDFDFIDLTTLVGQGRYRARVAVMGMRENKVPFQRFLDFEVFASEDAAHSRAIEGAKAWIDGQSGRDRLELPTGMGGL
jgi:hypothetical protein